MILNKRPAKAENTKSTELTQSNSEINIHNSREAKVIHSLSRSRQENHWKQHNKSPTRFNRQKLDRE